VFESFFGGGYYGFVEVANSAVQLITSGNYNLDELAEDVADRYEIDDNTRTATRVGTEMFTFAVDILDGGGAPTGQFSSSLRNFQDAGYGLTSSVFLAAADVLGNALGSENWINVWEGRDRSGADLSGGQRAWEAAIGVAKYAQAVILVSGVKGSLGGRGAKVNPAAPRGGEPATAVAASRTTARGFGNIGSHGPVDPATALSGAEKFLGPGYKEIAPGVFRSADGLRQFRMTPRDLLPTHGKIGPHVHFEIPNPRGGPPLENFHLPITP
jgi:hypothetical protein